MKKFAKRVISFFMICCMFILAISSMALASGGTGDATLSSLEVSPGTLTPEFSPDVYEYSVDVGADCDKLLVTGTTTDSGAKMVIAGNDSLQAGANTVYINVTAADGVTTARYTITVTRAAGEGESPAESQSQAEPEAPSQSETQAQQGAALPSDPFIAPGSTGSGETEPAAAGVTVTSAGRTITLAQANEELIPSGFSAVDLTIGGQAVRAWSFPAAYEADGFYLIYGTDQDGNTSFFIYDQDEGTVITAPDSILTMSDDSSIYQSQLKNSQETYQKTLRQRMWIIIGLAALCFILLIAFTASMTRNRHIREQYTEDYDDEARIGERERARRYEEDDYDDYDEEYDDDYGEEPEPVSARREKTPERDPRVRTIPREPEPSEEPAYDEFSEEPEYDEFSEEPEYDELSEEPEYEESPEEARHDAPAEEDDDLEFFDLDDLDEDDVPELLRNEPRKPAAEPSAESKAADSIPELSEDDLEELWDGGEPEASEPEAPEPETAEPPRASSEEEDDLDADFDLLDALLSDSVRSGRPEGADSIVNRAAEKAGRGKRGPSQKAPVNPVRESAKAKAAEKSRDGDDDFEILDL